MVGEAFAKSSHSGIQAERAENQYFKHYQSWCHRKRQNSPGCCTECSYVLEEVAFITFTHYSLALPQHKSIKCAVLHCNRKAETWTILVSTIDDHPRILGDTELKLSNMALFPFHLPGKYRQLLNTMGKYSNDPW